MIRFWVSFHIIVINIKESKSLTNIWKETNYIGESLGLYEKDFEIEEFLELALIHHLKNFK